MPRRRILLAALLFFCLFAPKLRALEEIPLDGEWQFAQDPVANPAPRAAGGQRWTPIDVPAILPQRHGKSISGRYRLRFDLPRDVFSPNAQWSLVIDAIRHADEVWLNGRRIGGEGRFSPSWRFAATNPQGMMRVYDIPPGLLRHRDNLLLIRTKIGFGPAWGAMFPGGAGIISGGVSLVPKARAASLKRQRLLRDSVVDAVFITLGAIDLLVIVLLLGKARASVPEFKWLVVTSVLMLLGASGHDIFYTLGLDIHAELLLMIALLGVPPSIALYFQAQYGLIGARALRIGIFLWLASSAAILLPVFGDGLKIIAWYCYSAIALASFVCALFCAIRGVREKRVAAKTQLLALVVYLLSIRTQWLPDVFFGHRNVQIGSLFYRYALLFAYFARVRQIQVDYRRLSQRVSRVADEVHSHLSRELHDGIGQKLASMKLQVQLAASSGDNARLRNIREELDSAIAALRGMLAGMHPYHLERHGLAAAIREEAAHINKMRDDLIIETRLDEITLETEQALQLFRIFQEAVGNAIHHGKASRILIELKAGRERLLLRCSDNGEGFNVDAKLTEAKKGLGLISLRERAALLDGELNIESGKGQGARISVIAPLSGLP